MAILIATCILPRSPITTISLHHDLIHHQIRRSPRPRMPFRCVSDGMGLYPDVARITRLEFSDEISNASSILVNGQRIVNDSDPLEVLAIQRDEVLHLPGQDPEPKGKLIVSGFNPAYFLYGVQVDHHVQ